MSMRLLLLSCLLFAAVTPPASAQAAAFRPPAIPLVTHDPYLSVWSTTNELTGDWSRHWTGAIQALCGLVRVDGAAWRFAGAAPDGTPAAVQTAVDVQPVSTTYTFTVDGKIKLLVHFVSPLLPDDLDLLSRPVSYVTFEAASLDAKPHAVQLYLDLSAEWAVNKPDQKVTWERCAIDGLAALRLGTTDQPVLKKKGDDLRIDWGYLYLAAPNQAGLTQAVHQHDTCRDGFVKTGALPKKDDAKKPRPAQKDWPVLATAFDLGRVESAPVSRHLMIAYDDLYSIELMGQQLRPYWRRNGQDMDGLLKTTEQEYAAVTKRCQEFDASLFARLTAAGGDQYARICALAYREAIAAQKLCAGPDGAPLMFPKENFSNGCISTVDVHYPAAPVFLALNTALLKAQLVPVMDYASSPRWKFPFAPHDLGTYPLANGQVYGGGEKTEKNQMPVEESANLLILAAAMAAADADTGFAVKYWPTLEKWAGYLREKGLDPENQLCTDDFAGHLAHNVNLSAKAIVALGAYARLCAATGRADDAAAYAALAKDMAGKWATMADDGDHYRLAFDKPGTWSQKYNLVWDKLLGLGLFPAEVRQKELAYYKGVMSPYGLPLDNRNTYTKLDWIFWTATLADTPEQFAAFIAPAWKFVNETPDRVPLTDWYDTVSAKMVGFQARPVIGGLFIRLLDTEKLFKQP